MTETRVEKKFSQIGRGDQFAGVFMIAQAVPSLLRATKITERKQTGIARLTQSKVIDFARIGLGIAFARMVIPTIVEDFKDKGYMASDFGTAAGHALRRGVDVPVGHEKKVKIPGAVVAGGGAALVGGAIYLINMLEQERNSTALREAPEEAELVRQAYDSQTAKREKVTIGKSDVELSGSQILAFEYADKLITEALTKKGANKREIHAKVNAFGTMLTKAFDPQNPNLVLQQAVQSTVGDTFEALLLEKELNETVGVLVERPRDRVIEIIRELPKKVDDIPLLRMFTPEFVKKLINQFAGEQNLKVGNLNLDPRDFVNKGSKETRDAVKEMLQEKFQKIIAEEKAQNATQEQKRQINDALSGVKIDEDASDKPNNVLLSATFVRMFPEKAPQVAEVVGVLDAIQGKPEVLGDEIASKLPSRRKRLI